MGVSNFRLLDQAALALERGNAGVLDKLKGQPILGLGPIIETTILGQTTPAVAALSSQYAAREFASTLQGARREPLRTVIGSNTTESWAALWLKACREDEWKEVLHTFQIAVQKALKFRRKTSGAKKLICGAITEMVDNIFNHSGAPATGIVAFLGSSESVEIVVGDAGIGILASLQTNPKFSYLQDAGTAMAEALKDGNSRYGPSQDRGYGFTTLFHSLNTLDAELRFRTGDYALEIAGRSPSYRNPRISQKAELRGFVVSIRIAL